MAHSLQCFFLETPEIARQEKRNPSELLHSAVAICERRRTASSSPAAVGVNAMPHPHHRTLPKTNLRSTMIPTQHSKTCRASIKAFFLLAVLMSTTQLLSPSARNSRRHTTPPCLDAWPFPKLSLISPGVVLACFLSNPCCKHASCNSPGTSPAAWGAPTFLRACAHSFELFSPPHV